MVLLSAWGIARNAKRVWTQQKSLHAEYTVRWSDDAVDISTPNMQAHHPWSDFIRWHESAATIMIYQSDQMFNFIPKTAFADGQLDDYRRCIVASGVPKARAFGR